MDFSHSHTFLNILYRRQQKKSHDIVSTCAHTLRNRKRGNRRKPCRLPTTDLHANAGASDIAGKRNGQSINGFIFILDKYEMIGRSVSMDIEVRVDMAVMMQMRVRARVGHPNPNRQPLVSALLVG